MMGWVGVRIGPGWPLVVPIAFCGLIWIPAGLAQDRLSDDPRDRPRAAASDSADAKDDSDQGTGAESDEAAGSNGLQPASPEAAAVYQDAANLQNHGEFEAAEKEWTKFLTKYPDDPTALAAHHYLGVCHLHRNDFKGASAQFVEVLRTARKKGLSEEIEFLEEAYANLAWSLYSLGVEGEKPAFAKAIPVIEAALKAYPKGRLTDQMLFYGGECCYLSGKTKEAQRYYARLIDSYPDSEQRPDALYALGVVLQDAKDWESASRRFGEFARDFPKHDLIAEVSLRLGETLWEQGQWAKAEEAYATARSSASFPMADYAELKRLACLEKQDHSDRVLEDYAGFAKRFPKSELRSAAMVGAGRCSFQGKKWAAARQWYEQAASMNPDLVPEAMHWIARSYLEERQWPRALDAVERGLRAAPKDSPITPRLELVRAECTARQEPANPRSVDDFLRVAKKFPNTPEAEQAIVQAAFAALQTNDTARAKKIANGFLQRYPQHPRLPDMRHVLAEAVLLEKDYAAAESLFTELLRGNPGHADSDRWKTRLGLALQAQGKHTEALESLSTAQEDAGPDMVAEKTILSARSHAEANERDAAIRVLEEGIAQTPPLPRQVEMLLFLASLLDDAGRSEASRDALQRIHRDWPRSDQANEARLRLADQAYDREEFDAAESYYSAITADRSASAGESQPNAELNAERLARKYYGLGWIAIRRNDLPKAEECFTRIRENLAGSSLAAKALQSRALVRQRQGNFEQARVDVLQYLQTHPEPEARAEGLYLLALCDIGRKRHDEALRSLESLVKEHPSYERLDHVLYELAWLVKPSDSARALSLFKQLARDYPESKLRGEALLHVGDSAYEAKDLAKAERAFREAAADAATDDIAETACYKQAFVLYQQDAWDQAKTVLTQGLARFPSGSHQREMRYLLAEILFARKDFAAAWEEYSRLSDQSLPDANSEAVKTLHGGQAALELKRLDDAERWLQKLWRLPESTAIRFEAGLALAHTLHQANRLAESERIYAEIAEAHRGEIGAKARFYLGEVLFAEKRYSHAMEQFVKVMYGYGGDQADDAIGVWQGKAALEAGRCAVYLAERQTLPAEKNRWTQQARKYFQYVARRVPGTREAEQAEKLLAR